LGVNIRFPGERQYYRTGQAGAAFRMLFLFSDTSLHQREITPDHIAVFTNSDASSCEKVPSARRRVPVPGAEANSRGALSVHLLLVIREINHPCFRPLWTGLNAGREASQRGRGERLMAKAIVIAALVAIMAVAPAYSVPRECTDPHMKEMDAMIAKMTDRTKKKEATAALNMSKAEMKKGNIEGCMKYMIDAHTAMLTARTKSH
jgi:hypothetical protein